MKINPNCFAARYACSKTIWVRKSYTLQKLYQSLYIALNFAPCPTVSRDRKASTSANTLITQLIGILGAMRHWKKREMKISQFSCRLVTLAAIGVR